MMNIITGTSNIGYSNMQNPYAPHVQINGIPTVTNVGFGDMGALATTMAALATDSKPKTYGETWDKLKDTPMPTVPLVYVNESSKHSNIGNDSDVKKSVIKYYYYKLLEKWIFNEMVGILAFVKLDSNKKPSLINSNDDFNIDKTSRESKDTLKIKAEFINDTFFTKDFVKHILKKIIKKNSISWYDLYDYESNVKKTIYLKTLKYLKSKTTK
jgi:hypothetical protein